MQTHVCVSQFIWYFIIKYLFLQARGPKRHLKRLNAPKAWMLDKLGGVYAPRPSTGPHKLRESLPLVIFLRNRLKYALTNCEVTKIMMQRLIKVDGKIRTDANYPAGFMGKFSSFCTTCNLYTALLCCVKYFIKVDYWNWYLFL